MPTAVLGHGGGKSEKDTVGVASRDLRAPQKRGSESNTPNPKPPKPLNRLNPQTLNTKYFRTSSPQLM